MQSQKIEYYNIYIIRKYIIEIETEILRWRKERKGNSEGEVQNTDIGSSDNFSILFLCLFLFLTQMKDLVEFCRCDDSNMLRHVQSKLLFLFGQISSLLCCSYAGGPPGGADETQRLGQILNHGYLCSNGGLSRISVFILFYLRLKVL